MSRITLDATLADKLRNATLPMELCDPSGQLLGRFVPLIPPAGWELVSPLASEEELDRREQSTEWYSTEEVLAHLKRLEEQ